MCPFQRKTKYEEVTQNSCCRQSSKANVTRKAVYNITALHTQPGLYFTYPHVCYHQTVGTVAAEAMFLPASEAWHSRWMTWKPLWCSWRLRLPAVCPATGTCSCSHRALLQKALSRVWYCSSRSAKTRDSPRSNHWTEWDQQTRSGSSVFVSASNISSFSDLKDTNHLLVFNHPVIETL